MDINQVFSGSSLKADDLQGAEPTVVISKIEMKEYDGKNKLVVHFNGKKKHLICNKTNANRIAVMYGTNTDLWVGNPITLYVDKVDFSGDLVDAIRVKVSKQQPPAPAPRAASTNTDPDDAIPF